MQLTPYEIFVDKIYAYHLDRKFYVSRFSKHLIFTHSSVKSIKKMYSVLLITAIVDTKMRRDHICRLNTQIRNDSKSLEFA